MLKLSELGEESSSGVKEIDMIIQRYMDSIEQWRMKSRMHAEIFSKVHYYQYYNRELYLCKKRLVYSGKFVIISLEEQDGGPHNTMLSMWKTNIKTGIREYCKQGPAGTEESYYAGYFQY